MSGWTSGSAHAPLNPLARVQWRPNDELISRHSLSGARGLEQYRLDTACGDVTTKLPEGLTIWPCKSNG